MSALYKSFTYLLTYLLTLSLKIQYLSGSFVHLLLSIYVFVLALSAIAKLLVAETKLSWYISAFTAWLHHTVNQHRPAVVGPIRDPPCLANSTFLTLLHED